MARRIMMADPFLPHQIIIRNTGGAVLEVTCNCMWWTDDDGRRHLGRLDSRPRYEPGEAVAVWREHLPC